ncbi:MAG: hypothetical protein HQL76_04640 [Magnetococcales bacterium]|nr:hypothetical protein [Magnetococcales bacterium]
MYPEFFLSDPLPANVLSGNYDWRLVLLSYAVAAITSLTAIDIAIRIELMRSQKETSPSSRVIWIGVGALIMGIGVWSMHFIGILAYDLRCGISYDFMTTFISIVPAIASSFLALQLAIKKTATWPQLFLAGVIMGTGIGTMHYIGMSAMRLPAEIRYMPDIFIFSILVAVLTSFISLIFTSRMIQQKGQNILLQKLTSGMIMAAAICGLHYTAMQASLFIPAPPIAEFTPGLSPEFFSGAICFLIFTILSGYWVQLHIHTDTLSKTQEKTNFANHARGILLSNISRDLRSPLNSILETAQTHVQKSHLSEESNFLAQVQHTTQAMLVLIENIDDFSLLESNSLTLDIVQFNVRQITEEVLDIMERSARDKGLIMTREFEEPLPSTLFGDPRRLRQILINLIHNAIKFTQSGFIAVIIKTPGTKHNLGPDYFPIHFIVIDTGIGIPRENQSSIFLGSSQTAFLPSASHWCGTGLGLSICKHLVEKSGGTLWVESDGSSGSTFHFNIPFRLNHPMNSQDEHNASKSIPR